jgi:hypothetical protein
LRPLGAPSPGVVAQARADQVTAAQAVAAPAQAVAAPAREQAMASPAMAASALEQVTAAD